MPQDFSEGKPIFQQIAERMEDAVLSGAFPEDGQFPSTTEISAAYRINPATALHGITLLVEEGVACKRRGVGMFVCRGAREKIREKRRQSFYSEYVRTLVTEAGKLGIRKEEITAMIERGFNDEA